MKNIIELETERLKWSLEHFTEATPISSLKKLEGEIKEVEKDLLDGNTAGVIEEYADCLMCLFDSAVRAGIAPETIFEAFALKLEKNKHRIWKKNDDNTYSHVKMKYEIDQQKLMKSANSEWDRRPTLANCSKHWIFEQGAIFGSTHTMEVLSPVLDAIAHHMSNWLKEVEHKIMWAKTGYDAKYWRDRAIEVESTFQQIKNLEIK